MAFVVTDIVVKGTSDLYNLLYKVVFYCWYFSFVVMHLTPPLVSMGA